MFTSEALTDDQRRLAEQIGEAAVSGDWLPVMQPYLAPDDDLDVIVDTVRQLIASRLEPDILRYAAEVSLFSAFAKWLLIDKDDERDASRILRGLSPFLAAAVEATLRRLNYKWFPPVSKPTDPAERDYNIVGDAELPLWDVHFFGARVGRDNRYVFRTMFLAGLIDGDEPWWHAQPTWRLMQDARAWFSYHRPSRPACYLPFELPADPDIEVQPTLRAIKDQKTFIGFASIKLMRKPTWFKKQTWFKATSLLMRFDDVDAALRAPTLLRMLNVAPESTIFGEPFSHRDGAFALLTPG